MSLDRWMFPTDAAAGLIPHKRPPRRWTRQFVQHYASQSLTNAADAQQKIAFRSQVTIIVDRQSDGLVDRSELAREVRDRRIGRGLSLRVDSAAVLAILPFRQARDDAKSDRLQLTQPTWASEAGADGEGLNNSQYSRSATRREPVGSFGPQAHSPKGTQEPHPRRKWPYTLQRVVTRACTCCAGAPWPPPFAPPTPLRSPPQTSPQWLRFVRRLHCYGEVRLLVSVHYWLRLLAFPMRTAVHTQHATTAARYEISQVTVRSLMWPYTGSLKF